MSRILLLERKLYIYLPKFILISHELFLINHVFQSYLITLNDIQATKLIT